MNTATPLDPAAARRVFVDQVYRPVLFEKLAAHGYEPQTPEEADLLCKMACHLRQAHDQQMARQGNVRPLLSKSAAALDRHLQAAGIASAAGQLTPERIKAAATAMANIPDLAHAYFSLAVAANAA